MNSKVKWILQTYTHFIISQTYLVLKCRCVCVTNMYSCGRDRTH